MKDGLSSRYEQPNFRAGPAQGSGVDNKIGLYLYTVRTVVSVSVVRREL